ncbi:MAG: arginine repressor [Ruminococcaceae bacterium]|nr:arginine repressor [Oscillospiraceae bacterium]
MKRKRHSLILKLIEEKPIATQEELLEYLCSHDYDVTQATVSRDIKELRLIKVADSNGRYRYSLPQEKPNDLSSKFQMIFNSAIKSVDYAMNIVCINCHSGMAQGACSALDNMGYTEIVGTVAGDDTIFVLCRTEENAGSLAESLKRFIEK